ncbi:hypothetical protein [Flavobacterium humi]|uniref:Phage holin family protein n=1 Tax=Flavobacterium humi TaxID=2562683 RepID=A0A4Z0L9K3_9FLAO|nr:hypothetical protein [Flavobacterium humi]TGD59145.1 hypothetical protein E4635_04645 [Flavobacterium humi]
MESNASTIEKLAEKAETYAKTTFELYKYSVVDKSADIFSKLAARLVITLIILMFFLMATIGLALWAGELLGKEYYGFFAIAAGYLVLALLLYVFRKHFIKKPVSNFIIGCTLKED